MKALSNEQKAALKKELYAMEASPEISNFVKQQAYEQVAKELNEKSGGACTAKAVELLCCSKKNVEIIDRFNHYVAAGYHGVLLARYTN